MGPFSSITISLALAVAANAFPQSQVVSSRSVAGPTIEKRALFDAASQLVNVSGDHAFVAPGPGDQRGPCPGLNALANHGYLPHSGVTSITQAVDGATSAFGMGVDLATVLAVYAAALDGDLTSFSIGGPARGLGSGLLNKPQGLSGSYNSFEGDGSPTRGDLYEYGNGYELQLSQFQALYDSGKADDNYDIPTLNRFRAERFQQSIDNNPYFFYGPFSGIVAQPAAYQFIYRLFGNKSEEYPEGRTTGELLKSFYAVSGEDGDFSYTPGHERIPENFYKCHPLSPYTLPATIIDAEFSYLNNHLEFFSVGGNTGTTNSFTGISTEKLTGGLLNIDTLFEGNTLFCFGLQLAIKSTVPDRLHGLLSSLSGVLGKLGSLLVDDVLSCPQITDIDDAQFRQFPGYTRDYDEYEGTT